MDITFSAVEQPDSQLETPFALQGTIPLRFHFSRLNSICDLRSLLDLFLRDIPALSSYCYSTGENAALTIIRSNLQDFVEACTLCSY